MQKFFKAFVYASNGLCLFFKHEQNGKIQLLAAVLAAAAGGVLKISEPEWIWLLACMAMVLSFEMMNSAIEKLCNVVQPEFHTAIKSIKDIAAAAVFSMAIFSAITGLIIFLPKILPLL